MYKYLPIEQAKVGDIVECIKDYPSAFTAGKLYQVKESENKWGDLAIVEDDKGSKTNGAAHKNFKLIKTKPGNKAQIGDTVFCIKDNTGICKQWGSL